VATGLRRPPEGVATRWTGAGVAAAAAGAGSGATAGEAGAGSGCWAAAFGTPASTSETAAIAIRLGVESHEPKRSALLGCPPSARVNLARGVGEVNATTGQSR